MTQFSIVITSFNQCDYVTEAIRSALDQTLPAKEIIVVDDCSSDGTPQVLDEFAGTITVIVNATNRGANESRNIAAARATGDYLVFLDGDDLFCRETLAVYHRLIANRCPDLLLSLIQFFSTTNPVRNIQPGEPIQFVEYPRLMLKDRTFNSSVSAIVVKRTAFERAGGWTSVFPCEDSDLFLRAGVSGTTVQILSPATVLKRVHGENITHNVVAMTNGLIKVIDNEHAGKYTGETAYARYCFIGGPAFSWLKACLSARAYSTGIKLFWMSWLMVAAAIFHKLVRTITGKVPVQHATL